jgi:hypothetical protein
MIWTLAIRRKKVAGGGGGRVRAVVRKGRRKRTEGVGDASGT